MQSRILTFDQFIQKNQPEVEQEPGTEFQHQSDTAMPDTGGTELFHGKPEPLVEPEMPSMSTGEFPTDPYAQPMVPEMPHGEEGGEQYDQNIKRLEEPNTPTQKLDEAWRKYSRRIR